MTIDPTRLGLLLKPSDGAWAELAKAILSHRSGFVVRVEEVRFRPPYCTLVTRGVADEVPRNFNTEALAKGAFTAIELDDARAEQSIHIFASAIRSAEQADHRAKEDERNAAAERMEKKAAEMEDTAAKWRAEQEQAAARIENLRRPREENRVTEEKRSSDRIDEWRKVLAVRNITRLTHFTRLENLKSILKFGLWPVTSFVELEEQPIRNDDRRFDGHLDKVSLSVTHPNDVLFYKWHADTYQAENWVVVCLDPSLLWELPCLLFPANAAREGGRTAITRSSSPMASDFEKLFAEPANGTRAQLGHGPSDTTDPQAEVMIGAKIAPRYFQSIGVSKAADLRRASDIANSVSSVPVFVDRPLFDVRRCASEFRVAQRAMAQGQLTSAGTATMGAPSEFDDDIPF